MFGMEVRLVVKKSAENPYSTKSTTNKTIGVGGWQGRKKRFVAGLKRSGKPLKKEKGKRPKKWKR